jgi:hypothetical protein
MAATQEPGRATSHGWMSEQALLLLADSAAQKAAKQAVNDTFLVLGIDLSDDGHVRATRDSMAAMRDRWHARRDRKQDIRRSIIHCIVTIAVTCTTTILTALVTFGKLHL